jgi:hypothetical protein
VAVLKFELLTLIEQKELKLDYLSDGRVLLINHPYSAEFDIYLDSSVAEHLEKLKTLILLNTKDKLFLVIEEKKCWKFSHINAQGDLWGGGLGGKLITKEGLKTEITCIEPDINFTISA